MNKFHLIVKMTNKEFAKQLENRTLRFAIDIIELSTQLPNTTEAQVIKNQLSKSGASVGANYREANRSRSARDFKNKIKISLAEASETDYWLNIIEELNWKHLPKLNSLRQEAKELLAIFTSITNKL